MSPDPTPDPARAGKASACIDVIISENAWEYKCADLAGLCERAAIAGISAVCEINKLLKLEGAEVAIMLSNNSHVQDLNRDYRDIDKPTNVLSFASFDADELVKMPEGADIILGDIVVAYETVVSEAEEEGKVLEDHLVHMIVHGVLHLLGFDHQSDEEARQMESLEIDVLDRMGIFNPYDDSKLDQVPKGNLT
jgi:probable rRNA maturation factor